MAGAVLITRKDHDAAGPRRLALALVLDGASRADAARQRGMDRQTLRDWVHRYNDEGADGLLGRVEGRGRKPLLTPSQMEEGAALVRSGPDLAAHGVLRWRRADLARVIEQRFGLLPEEHTVGKMLRRLGFRRLSVRPCHPKSDPQAQLTHKKTSQHW